MHEPAAAHILILEHTFNWLKAMQSQSKGWQVLTVWEKVKVKVSFFNVGVLTGKDCLLTWANGVKVADRRDRTRSLSLQKRCTNHCTTGPHTKQNHRHFFP